MTSTSLPHRRTHNLLLIQKLLTLRDGASPFTLILDSVEQSAKPLVRHYVLNAQLSKTSTVFISYETLSPPPGVSHVVKARRKKHEVLQKEVLGFCSQSKKTLIIIDTLHPLCTTPTVHLPAFLSSLLSHPQTTLLAIYHTDIPLPTPIPTSVSHNPYAPSPLTLLKYLVTTIFTLHSFAHVLARKRARDKSLPEPVFGLDEEKEGVLAGLGGNNGNSGAGALVLEMEYRRKSGRGVWEQFYFPTHPKQNPTLLTDHPSFHHAMPSQDPGPEAPSATFELGITDAQRKVREGVVLPYFDAQNGDGGGGGMGGRILYEMGVEDMDDFDEEEDEV